LLRWCGALFVHKQFRYRKRLEVTHAAKKMGLLVDVLTDVLALRRLVDNGIAMSIAEITPTTPRVWLNVQAALDYAATDRG
jgi:plasmid maintenance system antidote protein VapI